MRTEGPPLGQAHWRSLAVRRVVGVTADSDHTEGGKK